MTETTIFKVNILHSFIYPKMGEELSDCQDAQDVNCALNRFSVADGVSRSFYPAIFSKILTDYFCNGDTPTNKDLFKHKNWHEWLKISQNKWQELISQKVNNTSKYYIKNRYYNKEHAGATFAGIEFFEKDQCIYWNAMIIGDSCIIHFDKFHHKTNKYLIQNTSDFNFTPGYFPSLDVKENPFQPEFLLDMTASIDDIFIIATDAISKWILLLIEQSQTQILANIHNLSSEIVDKFRIDTLSPIENDDVSMLVLKIEQS